MSAGVWIVDAFTTRPFKGNPAGVCIMDKFPEDAKLQQLALQMYLPETAFLVKKKPLEYDLRWFTPEVEVKLCGHATLAATHVLLQSGRIKPKDVVTFQTLSGPLKARAGDNKAIELDFPLLAGKDAKPHAALKALDVEILHCEKNRDNYLVEVDDYSTLITCRPDYKKLAKADMEGVIITTATGVPAGFDFASRYFGPKVGIDEDLVTGSAHCFLAPYWAKKLGKEKFRAYQASKGEGILDVTIAGDRVLIGGTCVTTLKGQLGGKQKKAQFA